MVGDCRESLAKLPENIADTCVTSPPYFGLRDYGVDGQIGLEDSPSEFIESMVQVFREVHRVLRDDGTLWLNIGDSYAGSGRGPAGNLGKKHDERNLSEIKKPFVGDGLKQKDLIGVPWRLAFALQQDGWYLRQDIIWSKPNPMPESVRDRCTKSHEYIFLLSKSKKYYYDHEAIKEPTVTKDSIIRDRDSTRLNKVPGRTRMVGLQKNDYDMKNKRSVWVVPTKPFKGSHFAVFPPELIEPCILAGSREGGIVLDPFLGSGTTAVVAERHDRLWLGCELNAEYAKLATKRIAEGK